MTTSRERVHAAIHHEEPDRVPLDLGSTDVSSIHVGAYRRLCQRLGVAEDVRIQDPLQNLAAVSAEMRARLGVDTAGVWLNPTLRALDLRQLQIVLTPGLLLITHHSSLITHVKDEWETVWRMPEHGLWYEPTGFPLEFASPSQVASYAYPSPDDPGRLSGVAERAKKLYAETDCALVASFSGALLARGQLIRGPAQFLGDLLAEADMAGEILDRVLDYNIALVERFLDAVGATIEVIKVSDDLGAQDSLLISPALYRRMIKPRQARFFAAIRRKTSASDSLPHLRRSRSADRRFHRDRSGHPQSGSGVGPWDGHERAGRAVRGANSVLGRAGHPGRHREGDARGDDRGGIPADWRSSQHGGLRPGRIPQPPAGDPCR